MGPCATVKHTPTDAERVCKRVGGLVCLHLLEKTNLAGSVIKFNNTREKEFISRAFARRRRIFKVVIQVHSFP